MDFNLTSEQRAFRDSVSAFARKELAEGALERAHAPHFPHEIARRMAQAGLLGITLPEADGGAGGTLMDAVLAIEEVATHCPRSADVIQEGNFGAIRVLAHFANADQKRRYLAPLLRGEEVIAVAMTEPDAGSATTDLQTTATPDGTGWRINGSKVFPNPHADQYLVYVRFGPGVGGIGSVMLRRDAPGFSIGKVSTFMSGAHWAPIFFDNVYVPAEDVLLPAGGFKKQIAGFNAERIGNATRSLAYGRYCYEASRRYALERRQFGQPIAFFDAIRKKLAEMVVHTFVLDAAIYRTVGLMDERISVLDPAAAGYARQVMTALEDYAIEASISKILGSETVGRVTDHGVQVHGGYGFIEECPLAGAYRDCRIDRLFEGTNEINRMVIYGYMLKKALMDQLPLLAAEKTWTEAAWPAGEEVRWEIRALDAARRLTVKCLHQAICLYGQDLRNEQVVGEDLADLIIGYFGASAAWNRLLQLGDDRVDQDRALSALGRLVVASYLEDVRRLSFRLQPTLFPDQGSRESILEQQACKLYLPFDPVAEIRVLSDDLYHHGHYRF